MQIMNNIRDCLLHALLHTDNEAIYFLNLPVITEYTSLQQFDAYNYSFVLSERLTQIL